MKYFLVLNLFVLFSCAGEKRATNAPDTIVRGMVVSAHPVASEVGYEILKQGGNAYDAAVAVQFALAVVYPRAGNIAGGGFAVYRSENGELGALDFREKAPLKAHRDMYLDQDSSVVEGLSSFGALSVGVPGTVDGMIKLHKRYGVLPFKAVVQPSIELAESGYVLTEKEANKLNQYQEEFLKANDLEFPFLNSKGWEYGDSIQLPKLAMTLKRIRDYGRAGFYEGQTANDIVGEMEDRAGFITLKDLTDYESIWRNPIIGYYKGYKVITMSPPSSGGIALMQLLKGSEAYDFKEMGHNTVSSVHVMAELERRVYADRATYLGDPDFNDIPTFMLLDSTYIVTQNSTISMGQATPSEQIRKGKVNAIESVETTHFSIVDKYNNAIAITTTLNGNFGSKVFVEESGFFLNNEMDDFSVKPGVPNQYGLVGAEANAIEPGKRMLSSMTPTILEKGGEVYLVLGTPGGSTIITSVYQTILNVVEHGMPIQQAIDSKKVHHQWQPDVITFEDGALDSSTAGSLSALGHKLRRVTAIGRVDAILINEDEKLNGGADRRGDDAAVGF
jgi:gamma-glutamyltranspeptidase / glutathione hydrolase